MASPTGHMHACICLQDAKRSICSLSFPYSRAIMGLGLWGSLLAVAGLWLSPIPWPVCSAVTVIGFVVLWLAALRMRKLGTRAVTCGPAGYNFVALSWLRHSSGPRRPLHPH